MREMTKKGMHIPVAEYKASIPLDAPENRSHSIWTLLGAAGAMCEARAKRTGQFDRNHEAYNDGLNVVVACVMFLHEEDLFPNEFSTIH